MSNEFDEIAALREDADVPLQEATSIQGRVKPGQGTDETGEVVAKIDAEGNITSIQIGSAWEQRMSRDQLPVAIIEALSAARMARFEDWGQSAKDVAEETPARARPADSTHSVITRVREEIAGLTTDQIGDYTEGLLEDLRSGIQEADELLEEHLGREYVARSGHRKVTATAVANGDIVAVAFDQAWLANAHSANLGREVTGAVTNAIRVSQHEGLNAALRATKLVRLADLSALPDRPHHERP